DRVIMLTTKEFELLSLFLANPRQVLTRELIMDKVWGYDFSGESNVLEVYVGMLRQKLEEAGEKTPDPYGTGCRLCIKGVTFVEPEKGLTWNLPESWKRVLDKMSLRMRLAAWYSSLVGLTLLVFGVFLYLFLSHNLFSEVDQSVTNQADQVVRSITVVGEYRFPLSQVVLPDVDVFATPDTYLQVVKENGEIAARSNNLGSQVLPLSRETLLYAVKGKGFYETIETGGQKLRIYNLPLTYNDRIIGILQVGRALATVERALSRLSLVLLVGGVGMVAIAGLVGWLLAGLALKPIGSLIQATARIQEAKDLQQQIPYDGPEDEIGELTATINDMLARLHSAYESLEESITSQKRFVADASHELRTPLTVIRGNVELLQKMGDVDPEARREVLADIASETGRLTRLVNDLLALARADTGIVMATESVNLLELLGDLERQAELIPSPARFAGLQQGDVPGQSGDTSVSGPREPIWVMGNEDYLKQLFLSITDNALKYTPPGGQVWLTLAEKQGWVGVSVHDTGSGIAKEDIPRIFQRFYRADRARVGRGTGLGLAIAQWIVEKHGGNIEVESEVGRGSTFTVWLPKEQ
ncbi:MAG TPA: ATP-binding protein, partial [Bacillota bacterium]|nr:ATP-binding protein [Bacillota bacterium]